MKHQLSKNVIINLSVKKGQILNQSRLVLSAGSFCLAYGEILNFPDLGSILDQTIGSEHWMSDTSDIFRFFKQGDLHSILSQIPCKSKKHINDFLFFHEKNYFQVEINPLTKPFQVEPVSSYFFDIDGRAIYCFNERAKHILNIFHLDEHFALIFNDACEFSGWKLDRPIEIMSGGFQGEADESGVGQNYYFVFGKYFEMLSDDFCNACDDDMELVVIEIQKQFSCEFLNKISGKRLRVLLEKSIKEMEDYFL